MDDLETRSVGPSADVKGNSFLEGPGEGCCCLGNVDCWWCLVTDFGAGLTKGI